VAVALEWIKSEYILTRCFKILLSNSHCHVRDGMSIYLTPFTSIFSSLKRMATESLRRDYVVIKEPGSF
jgi:hypothetical protein